MKNIEITVTINKVEHKSTSYNGNPSYWVYFTDMRGFDRVAYTATDAACGYGCANYVGRVANITYHITRNGNTIIDYIN